MSNNKYDLFSSRIKQNFANNKTVYSILGLIIIALLFFYGGLGNVTMSLVFVGVMVSYSFIYFLYLVKGEILFPKGTVAYSVFLLFFLISLVWSRVAVTTLVYFFMFLAGGLFWIFFYNYKKQVGIKSSTITSVVLFLGFSFGLISLYYFLTKSTAYNASGLINYTVPDLNHHHIGDLWSAILGPLILMLTKKEKRSIGLYLCIIVGIFFLAVSFSRSAYLSLIVGLIYMISQLKLTDKLKKFVFGITFLIITMLILSSVNKGFLTHRLFYISGLLGTFSHPFGVGIGGFGLMLQENQSFIKVFGYSSIADNIFLDVVVGMGVLSLPFFIWFATVTKPLIYKTRTDTLVYKLFFLILSVNFMFNHIYVIPVVLWLWFSALAMWQE